MDNKFLTDIIDESDIKRIRVLLDILIDYINWGMGSLEVIHNGVKEHYRIRRFS